MASSSSAKHLSLFVFFLAILFSASSQVEAREGRLFFSKVTRLIGTTNKVVTEVPTSTPTPTPTPTLTPTSTPAPAPAPEAYNSVPAPAPTPATEFGTESDSGYGLYRTRETPATGVENEMLTEEFAGEEGYGKSNYNVESGRGRGNYYGNNGYENERSGREQQGMSDTRFLENGKYYHDVKNENENGNKYYYNGYDDQTAERGQRYVFDSIEEYEKYQESQGTYVP